MNADTRFKSQTAEFWANVRTISQAVGYTVRKKGKMTPLNVDRAARTAETKGTIRIPTVNDIKKKYAELDLSPSHIFDESDKLTPFGAALLDYFKFRAEVLETLVEPHLMEKDNALAAFNKLRKELNPKCPMPMNKQKGNMKNHAFLTGIVNMLIETNIGEATCDYNPTKLTTVTQNRAPLRTLSRRVDGAFPSVVNPFAIWEIKEYYYTTTFGSRVADGVYESMLDGYELSELEKAAGHKIQHLLIVDDYFTWWVKGRSYLCRIIDMLHMGFLDEVLFGNEVLDRLPVLVKSWKAEMYITKNK